MTPKLTQIANLIKLAKIDGKLDHREVMLIYGIAHKNGVNKFEMDEIIERNDSIETTVPRDESERIRYFYQLLVLSSVDFSIDSDEVEMLKRVGGELKLDPAKIDSAIQHAIDNSETDLSDDAIAQIIG